MYIKNISSQGLILRHLDLQILQICPEMAELQATTEYDNESFSHWDGIETESSWSQN